MPLPRNVSLPGVGALGWSVVGAWDVGFVVLDRQVVLFSAPYSQSTE